MTDVKLLSLMALIEAGKEPIISRLNEVVEEIKNRLEELS